MTIIDLWRKKGQFAFDSEGLVASTSSYDFRIQKIKKISGQMRARKTLMDFSYLSFAPLVSSLPLRVY
jgi:hypothetical protein